MDTTLVIVLAVAAIGIVVVIAAKKAQQPKPNLTESVINLGKLFNAF